LYGLVVVDPQWLLNKLAAVIADELHVENLFFDEAVADAGMEAPLTELRKSGIATKALLSFLWKDDIDSAEVAYLIDFMKDTWLLSEQLTGTYLVASLLTQAHKDDTVDTRNLDGLQCELQFEWLPNGVFQRLVAQCVRHAATLTDDENAWTCDVGKTKAKLAFGYNMFAVEVHGDTIVLKVDPDADEAALTMKKLVSMIRQQQRVLFRDLEFTLLVCSGGGSEGCAVEYATLVQARAEGRPKVKGKAQSKGAKYVSVASFDAFFDDHAGALDSESEGPKASELTVLKKLSPGLVNHVFISHIQSNGGDLAGLLYGWLANRGLKVWYDKMFHGELNEQAMLEGVRQSKTFLLLLTKDVFKSGAVLKELEQAISAGKRVMFVHESEPGREGNTLFSHYTDTIPVKLKYLFNKVESVPARRAGYEIPAFLTKIIRRIDE